MPNVERERREAEHFDGVYGTEWKTGELRVSESSIQRYRDCPQAGVYGKERLFSLAQPLEGRDVLEMGCGGGINAVLLAAQGARVWAYDISREAVEIARQRTAAHGYQDRIRLAVADTAEKAFPGQTFDVIFGNVVLHHLDLNGMGEHLRSLVRPGGRCVFREPVIRSPTLGLLHRLCPWHPSNPSPDERPLTDSDIVAMAAPFRSMEVFYFECFSRFWQLVRWGGLPERLHLLDAAMFRRWPLLTRFASAAVFRLNAYAAETELQASVPPPSLGG